MMVREAGERRNINVLAGMREGVATPGCRLGVSTLTL